MKVDVDFDVSFLAILAKVDDFYDKAKTANDLWLGIRSRVHQERFGSPPS